MTSARASRRAVGSPSLPMGESRHHVCVRPVGGGAASASNTISEGVTPKCRLISSTPAVSQRINRRTCEYLIISRWLIAVGQNKHRPPKCRRTGVQFCGVVSTCQLGGVNCEMSGDRSLDNSRCQTPTGDHAIERCSSPQCNWLGTMSCEVDGRLSTQGFLSVNSSSARLLGSSALPSPRRDHPRSR